MKRLLVRLLLKLCPNMMLVPTDPRYPGSNRPRILNVMKAECIGEFSFKRETTCSACFFDEVDEPQGECEVCQGQVHYEETIVVPWDTCKDIYKKMAVVASENRENLS